MALGKLKGIICYSLQYFSILDAFLTPLSHLIFIAKQKNSKVCTHMYQLAIAVQQANLELRDLKQ